MRAIGIALALALIGCGRPPRTIEITGEAPVVPVPPARLPAAPGEFAPSLLALTGAARPEFGANLADVDTCATCHADVAAQWDDSAHSFASFGNPIYRSNVELARRDLGNDASRHCGGCHDLPLIVDQSMHGDIPPQDLRSHSGVTCRVCHGARTVAKDGNASFTLDRTPIPTPVPGDAASIERHRAAVKITQLGSELCVTCHRGFLSPDLGVPVHIAGIDEPTAWRSSAWTGNGAGRIDKVEPRTCIDCHMTREAAGADEASAHGGTVVSHRFVGGHTWMAAMRGDAVQLEKIQAQLRASASIDIAAAIVPAQIAGALSGARTVSGAWVMPAEAVPVVPGSKIEFAVVIRNLAVGHRFPGGVQDMQDTWIEVAVTDARGALIASSGASHDRQADDPDRVDDGGAHVLRSFPVGADGVIRDRHELAEFRAIATTQTLAPRDATIVRYALAVPKGLPASALPLQVTARLRHRSRSLREQAVICADARTPIGKAFARGAEGARSVAPDPCAPQPITELVAQTIAIGGPQVALASARPAWERQYELGMALVGEVGERLDEARLVLEAAQALTPAGADGERPRAMIDVQLAWVAGKQGRTDDALALVERARGRLPAGKAPAVLDAIAADALARVWRWKEAVGPARRTTEKAPGSTAAWVMLARVLGSTGDDRGALAAAQVGLALAPRDPDLLRSQAVALRALGAPDADAALAAYERFRAPDDAAQLRITCADTSKRCAREREIGHVHLLVPAAR
jgi:tetratricopeptide (TPR) repeat protein